MRLGCQTTVKEANDMVTAPMLAEHFEAGDFGRDEKSYKLVLGGLSKKAQNAIINGES